MSGRRHLPLQRRVVLLVLLTAAPTFLSTVLLLWSIDVSSTFRWSLVVVLAILALTGVSVLRHQIVQPLRSLASLIEALREGDYAVRGRWIDAEDVLGEVMLELNALSQQLHDQRLAALEAHFLLEKFISEADLALFAFDAQRRLCRLNHAAGALFECDRAALLGRSASELGLQAMLEMEPGRILSHTFPRGAGRWEIRRRTFREQGQPREMLVIADVSAALRAEERQAWRRLIRVIGHEINSSLVPIRSIADTVRKLIEDEPLADEWREDTRAGLGIIRHRAESLGRFMGAYARLASLPPPNRQRVQFPPIAAQVASLFAEKVLIDPSPDVALELDRDQIEQALINIIKNGIEAAQSRADAVVRIRWTLEPQRLIVEVRDNGCGLGHTESLWVPFFTTKTGGSGIGLVLSREILENHGGSITLENNVGSPGCTAQIVLPLGG